LKTVATIGTNRGSLVPVGGAGGLVASIGTAAAVAIAYFFAVRLELGLLAKTENVALFWPTSGFAVGTLISLGKLGRRARVSFAFAVVSASIAASLAGDNWILLLEGLCGAGAAVLVAEVIELWFDREFAFVDLRRVLGFMAAACLGAIASAVGVAATKTVLHTAASFWESWRACFISSGVGILVVAPLMIELGQVRRKLPSQAEWIEGGGVLTLLAVASWYAVSHPTGSWLSFDPDAVVLPLLLWLTARCQPFFGIAGAFVASITVVYATAFGIGHFGDTGVPIVERVEGTQVAITIVTVYTLVMAALFAERRRNEARLQLALDTEEESKARLANALVAGQVMAFEWDACTGLSQRENASHILGFKQGNMDSSPRADFLKHVHPDDREGFKKHVRELRPDNPSYALTFRFVRPDGHEVWLEETARGQFDAVGGLRRLKGLTRDITDHKELEEHKNLLIGELDHRVKNVLSKVSVIASHTEDTSSSMAEFVTALDGRIKSLATTHELLSDRCWKGVCLAELVRRELAPYNTGSNTKIDGSDEVLAAEAGQAIAMVLHELTTNAAKYGALSGKDGRVKVHWSHKQNGQAESSLCIHWEELGGPTVMPPSRSGYGTSVIRDLIPYELGGTVDLVHALQGVRCKLEIPAQWLMR
jgi:PAS domain S-box-containing protein